MTTARLRAERLRDTDFAEIRRMHQDPDTMTWLGGVQTVDESRAYFERNLAQWDRHGHGLYLVYEAAGSEVVGRAVLRHLDLDGKDEVEIGYAFYAPYRRRGYATEVTQAFTAIGFDQLGLASAVALTMVDNVASQGVLVKCGFERERALTHAALPHLLFRRLRPSGSAREL